MLSIAFLIGLIVGVVKLSSQTRRDEKIVLQKGVSEDLWMVFSYSIWLFVFPPLVAAFLPTAYSLLGAIILACFYLPTIITSRMISPRVSKGFDFERKVGRNIDRITLLGYAGIGVVVFNWAMINATQMLNAGRE
jgi:hypothetical protein